MCQKAYLDPVLTKKSLNIENFSNNSRQKTRNEQLSTPLLFLNIKPETLPLTFSTIKSFRKIDRKLAKNTENVKKNNGISSTIH